MTRINGADAVLQLLHEQLARLNRNRGTNRPAPAGTGRATPGPVERLREIAARNALSEDDLRRALVRTLLVQQFGDAVANDPAFERMAGEVAAILERSDTGRALVSRALDALADQGAGGSTK